MSDNVDLASLTGTCAADDVGGILYQRVKVAQGVDGSATDVSSAAPLQVTGANGSFPVTDSGGSLTVDGTVATTQSGTWTVQPGNTANTTAWKVDASSVAVPITDNSGSLTVDGSVKLLDTGGTNVATVKAASSGAAATTDTALVATLRDVNSNGQATAANSAPVVYASDRGHTTIFTVTLSLDTAAYASGDVLADTQQMDAFFAATDHGATIQSISVIDQDDQKSAFTIFLLNANVSLGTENSGPSISDANALNVIGKHAVATADYIDLGGVSVAHYSGLAIPVKAVSGTDDLYVAVLNGTGTPTYTASGVKLIFGIKHD